MRGIYDREAPSRGLIRDRRRRILHAAIRDGFHKKPECERSGFFMRQDKSISTSSESKFHFIPEKTILGVQIHREEM